MTILKSSRYSVMALASTRAGISLLKFSRNLKIVFDLQGKQQFRTRFADASVAGIILAAWGHDIRKCLVCGMCSMHQTGRSYNPRE